MKLARVLLPERPLCQRGYQGIRRLSLQNRVLDPQHIAGGYVGKTWVVHFVELDRQAQRTRKPLSVKKPCLDFIDMRGVLGMHALHVKRRVTVDLVQAKQTTRQA
ncbi:hypothetical protein D3C72_2281690 [compost metagenome]